MARQGLLTRLCRGIERGSAGRRQHRKRSLLWLADGRKLGGILIETVPLPGGERACVVGVGLNVQPLTETEGMASHGRAVFLSDFLGDLSGIEAGLARAADRGVKGVLLQVLDPAEEEFPFDGRTIFESMGGSLRHETRQAGELRSRYLSRLAGRKDRLATLARAVGWHFSTHHTGQPAQSALLWAYAALQGGR